jgi:hypothetical protein
MKLDRAEFRQCALAVLHHNKYAIANFGYGEPAVEVLVNFMVGLAYTECYAASYVATYGFALTAFKACDGERMVHATVCASLFSDLEPLEAPAAPAISC